MKGETSRPAQYFTASEWVNRKPISLGDWPQKRKGQIVGRKQAGAARMVRGFIQRLEREGKL